MDRDPMMKLHLSALEVQEEDGVEEFRAALAQCAKIAESLYEEMKPTPQDPVSTQAPAPQASKNPKLSIRPFGLSEKDDRWLQAFLDHRKKRVEEEAHRHLAPIEIQSGDLREQGILSRFPSQSGMATTHLSPIIKPRKES